MNLIMRAVRAAIRTMSTACSKGDHMGCPGMSCDCSCHTNK